MFFFILDENNEVQKYDGWTPLHFAISSNRFRPKEKKKIYKERKKESKKERERVIQIIFILFIPK